MSLDRLPATRWATKVDLYRMLVRGRRYLDENYASASLAIAAEAAGMSPYHFNRLFRALFRETPHEYLTSIRLRRARVLLRTSDLLLREIAIEVGLAQASSFARLFRQRYGISPREFGRRP